LSQYINSILFQHSQHQVGFIAAHDQITKRLVEAQGDSVHLLASYYDAIWPADNLACVASLSQKPALQKKWMGTIERSSTSALNLIHHYHESPEIARGSSQALINYLNATFDESRAKRNNKIYSDHFIKQYFALQLVKEYHDGGEGDIDSGPLLFGYGSVATIVNIKTQAEVNDDQLKLTWGLLNAMGLPINLFGKKYYLFKQELIFDIFMLWCSVELID